MKETKFFRNRILKAVIPALLKPALAVDASEPLVHVVDGVTILL